MRVSASAKINLTLEVLGLRPDGYHDLRSVVLPIPLADEVEIAAAAAITVSMDCEVEPKLVDLPPERNLAWRAVKVLQESTGCGQGARIHIVKRIPSGAGLGGGSADAAAVLRGLNELWGLSLPLPRLAELGAAVGSDVPALVWGGPVLMEGRGERVSSLPPDFPLPDMARLELGFLPLDVSTPRVFAEFRETDRGQGANDLQPAACRLYPQILESLRRLREAGCEGVQMTGSGGTVFGWRRKAVVDVSR